MISVLNDKMASEDVIELGSSEDELEPAPKRAKPRPNAMVHIPTNLRGITIKPTSSKIKPISSKINIPVKKGPQKQAVTLINVPVHNATNQFVKNKPNGKTVQKLHTKKQTPPVVNPVSLIQKLSSQQVVINKITAGAKLLKNPIQLNSSQTINKLPPGISVTRSPRNVHSVQSVIPVKRLAGPQISNSLLKKQKLSAKAKPTGEILTVELDDDETSTSSTASPQWYLRPEQQQEESMKDINNEEPKVSNLVEITIEDSPVKPKLLHKSQVKDLLSVNIDDSPVKLVTDKKSDATASEEEDCSFKKVPNSKKKLEYPNEVETMKTIEIEIEPVPQLEVATEVMCTQTNMKQFPKDIIVEIEDSPIKILEVEVTTPEKDNSHAKIPVSRENSTMHIKNLSENSEVKIPDISDITNIQDRNNLETDEIKMVDTKINNIQDKNKSEFCEGKNSDTSKISNMEVENKQESSKTEISDTTNISDTQVENKVKLENYEFHPIYQSFIDLCFKLENSEDMKKIVEKKVKAYYLQCPKEYTESEEFLDMVSGKILSMKAGPEKMYLYMKDIVDELNLQRKVAKNQLQTVINANKESEKKKEKESENFLYGEDSEFDDKRKRQIRKLEKTLKKLHRAIQKLEEQEVDFDDEEDSVYLLTERYKERMVRVHAKFCQLTNTKMPSEPRVQIDPRLGQPAGPAKRLEKWINKKVPIGTALPFPDFHDVLRCVRDANDEDRLGWNEADIMQEARDLFTRCGSKLQRRRQENEWRSAISRISLDIDPAENNDELKKKLENNRQEANKKVAELLNKYADKQNQLKLEGTEIGDKEAEESPVESEEEEVVEEVPLENKNKRKELLRRLLQEKSRKSIDDKENQSSESLPVSQNDLASTAVEDINTESTTAETSKDKNLKEVEISDEAKKHVPGEEENKENLNKDNSQIVNDDDEYKIESDIDELHLLQKLHSENEVNSSTLDSSDSDSPIAISDTLESSSEDIKHMSDVISIENSSYSESEMNEEANDIQFIETTDSPVKNLVEKVGIHRNIETENTLNVSQRITQTTNEEYSEAIEDILLASSDDEAVLTKEIYLENINPCVNLKDDNLSIGETVVEGIDENNEKEIDENTQENNKTSYKGITSDENVVSLDNKNIPEHSCLILDDCLSSESASNDNCDKFGGSVTQEKCTAANEYSECVSLDDHTDENTADSACKSDDNGIVDESVFLSEVHLSAKSIPVSILDDKSDNNPSSSIMIESHSSKECLHDKHLSKDRAEFLDTNVENFVQSRNSESEGKIIDNYLDDVNSHNAEMDANFGQNADMNNVTGSNLHNKKDNSRTSSPTKNKSLHKNDAVDIGVVNNDEVVSGHVEELDSNTDILKYDLVTHVNEDTSAIKVDEFSHVSNLSENKFVIKDNVKNT